jgi:hypothetical protein
MKDKTQGKRLRYLLFSYHIQARYPSSTLDWILLKYLRLTRES